ncbi:ComF family protein [Xanthomonas sp. XNM01]|uniref:ComF family protein n=1 Tax=Xanthomonas sp. XNM01 TaxID=2769289 RepID=UPI00177BF45C|nr:ComF family protein [Xanthomonas sp. XNM01]MBD9370812.1 ComF family protein [Xanthomonas sp. XNM01]
MSGPTPPPSPTPDPRWPRLLAGLRRLVRSDWLLPRRCLVCDEAGDAGRDLCEACRQALPVLRSACRRCALPLPLPGVCGHCQRHPPALDAAHAAFLYAPPLDRLLPRLKFHRDLPAGRLLSGLMIEAFAGLPRPQALVPVPLHRARLRRRGYDQALELARPLARAFDVPLLRNGLVRTRATSAQSDLDAPDRRRNLRGAFALGRDLVHAAPILPDHVVLVDDVMTTGSTLEAAARVLRLSGVHRVDAWVCARVP